MTKRLCMGTINLFGEMTDDEMLEKVMYSMGRELITNPEKYGVHIEFINDQMTFNRRVFVEVMIDVPKTVT